MSEITDAAELDALPYHSTAISIERYVVVQRCADGRWRTPGMTDAFTTTRLIDWGLAPLAVLWRPGRPAQPTVLPSVEEVAEVLNVHRWQTMGVTSVQCECGEIVHGDSSLTGFPADQAFREHIAQAILALGSGYAEPAAKPSVEAVAETLYRLFTSNLVAEWDDINDDSDEPRSGYLDAARAVLALIGGRTEAEVRAEALEEAAGASMEWIFFKPDGWGSNPADQSAITAMSWVLDWLRARAAAIRGEQ